MPYIVYLPLLIFCLLSCSRTSPLNGTDLYSIADSLYLSGDYCRAMDKALELSTLARKDGNNYLSGRAEDLIADIIAATYGGEETIGHRLKAAKFYLLADSMRAHRYALVDASIDLANNGNAERAICLIDSIRKATPSDSALRATSLRAQLRVMLSTTDSIGVGKVLTELGKLKNQYAPSPADYAYLTIAYRIIGDSSDRYLPELKMARMEVNDIRDFEIIDYALRGRTQVKSRYSAPQPENTVINVQRDFFRAQAETEEKRASSLYLTLIAISAVSLTLLCCGLMYYRMRMKLKDAEIESGMEALASLTDKLTADKGISDLNGSRIENLFRERWQTINFLCNEFFEKGDSEKARASILNEVEREIERLRTPRKLRQIEQSVNDCMDNIMTRLRQQCPELKADEITFATFVYAGFSPRAVCLFTGIKLKYFYTKRSRLIARIEASSAPDRAMFIEKLG